MAAVELKTERFQMMLAPSEITAIDDMRFRERVQSRAEAIRQLIQRGLRASNPGARNEDADEVEPRKLAPSASLARPEEGPSP